MDTKVFIDKNGKDLKIKSRKHGVIFENESDIDQLDVYFYFEDDDFSQVIDYIINVCNLAWDNFEPKEAYSLGTDYYDYYDRKLDNNGYLSIDDNGLYFGRPMSGEKKLYQLNKAKAQSFVYDLIHLRE